MTDKIPRGFTLTEVMITVAILAVVAVPLTVFFTSGARNVVASQNKAAAQEELRQAIAAIEPVFMESNEVLQISTSSIMLCLDSCAMDSYQMQGDFDGDGIANIQDPDDDDDAPSALTLPATAQWAVGYDLKDDDDDNDGKIDLRVSFYLSDRRLMKAVSVNEGPWQTEAVIDGISYFAITPYGAKREDMGKNIDTGNDGVPNTGDSGENDGIITAREIDWTLPARGHGNRSGGIDTPRELKYICSLYIEIGVDKNSDGVEEYRLRTEIAPPLLTVKRRM